MSLIPLLFLVCQSLADDRQISPAQPTEVLTGRRVALVIGNGDYAHTGRLARAPDDARRVAKALQADGFDVTARYDLALRDMDKVVLDFQGRLADADVGFFYYSGHALQIADHNYLVPVDANLTEARYVSVEALDVMKVLQAMDNAGSDLNVVVLDACRNNPWASKWLAGQKGVSTSQGLASMDAPSGFIVAYATGPGSVAADDGTYAASLEKNLLTPGREIVEVFSYVHEDVKTTSGEGQIPWVSLAKGPARFYPAGAPAPVPEAAAPPVLPSQAPRVRPLVVATGVTGAVSVATLALAAFERSRWDAGVSDCVAGACAEDPEGEDARLDSLRTRTNALGWTGLGLGVATLGLTGVTVFTVQF